MSSFKKMFGFSITQKCLVFDITGIDNLMFLQYFSFILNEILFLFCLQNSSPQLAKNYSFYIKTMAEILFSVKHPL
jgi:hypothetical protein